jgi:hypothetical protein
MKNPVLVFAALLISSLAVSLAAEQGDDLRDMYLRFLNKKGYTPKVDSDGDVTFKRGDHTYFVDVHAKDREFFMIVLPNIWPIESATERTQVLRAADHANATSKAAKVFTKENDVWVSVEMFVADPQDFTLVFDRAMSSIDNTVEAFLEKMKE